MHTGGMIRPITKGKTKRVSLALALYRCTRTVTGSTFDRYIRFLSKGLVAFLCTLRKMTGKSQLKNNRFLINNF
jgi:hypothetical protein